MSTDVEDRIIELRKQLTDDGFDAGPASIHDYLVSEGWDPIPSVSTIWRGLHRRGFIVPQPKKRPRSSLRSFVCDRPNECWQIDAIYVLRSNSNGVEFALSVDQPETALPHLQVTGGTLIE